MSARVDFRQAMKKTSLILECGTDYRALWKLMNQLVGRRRATESHHPGTSKKRAKAFSEFFSSKIRLLREFLALKPP